MSWLVCCPLRILRLEGTLSASMNFILGLVSPVPGRKGAASEPVPLSEAVRRAGELGILERDPTEDLEGVEMAQKLLVLGERETAEQREQRARQCGRGLTWWCCWPCGGSCGCQPVRWATLCG